MNQINKIKRNSSFEILRIISMFAIILGHFSYHGNFELQKQLYSFNKVFLELIQAGGDFGINCFIMISSYFMVELKFKVEQVIKIIYKVWTYSVGFLLLFIILGHYNEGIYMILKSFIPILSNIYWFATTYIIFYMLIPFINIFINNINRKIHFRILCICLGLWCVLPTITPFELMYNELIWFISLYIVISYIKIYEPKIDSNFKIKVVTAILSFLLIVMSVIILTILSNKIPKLNEYITFFERRNKIPMFLFSLSIFLIFKEWNIKYNKYINILGGTTFGVYLIHDNPLVRNFLWNNLFRNNIYLNSNLLWIYSLGVALITLFLSSIIDISKQYTIDRLVNKLLINSRIKKIFLELIGKYLNFY